MQLNAPGLTINADPVRLRQVIHNLLKNALEAVGDQGSILVSSRIGEEEGDDFVEIAVSDNGPGFDPKLIGQVFDPYVTSKTRGTGLGLAIVKRIVAEHGGVIDAENPEAGGGRVVLRLPALAREQDGETPSQPGADARGAVS
jgi:nitrogen fixation/metabolism regulation signal transduction histidine kinase